jgi:hypothetical protein
MKVLGIGLFPQSATVTPLPHVIAGATSSSAAYGGHFQMPGHPASMSMAMPAAALGYAQTHGAYRSERSRQSKKVYATQALSRAGIHGNTINLIVQFGREVQAGGKTKLEIINVREANNFMSSGQITQITRAFKRDVTMFPLIRA